jgi:hypothetical protein
MDWQEASEMDLDEDPSSMIEAANRLEPFVQ